MAWAVTYDFTTGTRWKAGQLNKNFGDVKKKVDNLGFDDTDMVATAGYILVSNGMMFHAATVDEAGLGHKTVAQTWTSKTLTSPTLNGGVFNATPTIGSPVLNGALSGNAFLDEDTFASDSSTKMVSQQSFKAYVDNRVTGLCKTGTYIGSDGLDRSITGIGFAPKYVFLRYQGSDLAHILLSIEKLNQSWGLRSVDISTGGGNIEVNETVMGMIASLDSDGFSVSGVSGGNVWGSTYYYLAIG